MGVRSSEGRDSRYSLGESTPALFNAFLIERSSLAPVWIDPDYNCIVSHQMYLAFRPLSFCYVLSNQRLNAMFDVPTPSWTGWIARELQENRAALDIGARGRLGVSGFMFRTVKWLFYICVIVSMGYLIEFAGVEPLIAMAFAILLISGPEALEEWLMHIGRIRSEDTEDDTQND